MFKKSERLRAIGFNEILRRAKRRHFPHLTILTLPSEQRQVAVVIGKKVSKSAVCRNTLKRRIMATLRQELLGTGFKGVLVVIVKPSFATLPRVAATDVLRQAIADVIKTA